MNVVTWRERLDAMDHSGGTTNRMIQHAMRAEIMALRKALREQPARAESNKESSQRWRAAATRYQQLAAKAKP